MASEFNKVNLTLCDCLSVGDIIPPDTPLRHDGKADATKVL